MKAIRMIAVFAMAFIVIQSCQNNPDKKWDAKSSADTLNNMKDSVADPNKSITKDLVMKVNKDDARFAVEAANGGMAEVVLGNLAKQKGVSEQVRNFGEMMVKDHSAANLALIELAKNKGISLPKDISDDEKKIKENLSSKSGSDFDKAYINDMIKDHQNDIKSFATAIKTCRDTDLKAFAMKTLPTLKMHLTAIQKIYDTIK